MPNLLREVRDDIRFVKMHSLQPKWYKFGKIFLLLGGLGGYAALFGLKKMLIFLGVFLLLSLMVHMLYRVKTRKFTRSWLDFVVEEVDGVEKPTRIGGFYYTAVAINAVVAVVTSLWLA